LALLGNFLSIHPTYFIDTSLILIPCASCKEVYLYIQSYLLYILKWFRCFLFCMWYLFPLIWISFMLVVFSSAIT
jgi:hypothetical protein